MTSTVERNMKSPILIECDRAEYERRFLRIACMGSNDEFSEAVRRLTKRADLRAYNVAGPSRNSNFASSRSERLAIEPTTRPESGSDQQ